MDILFIFLAGFNPRSPRGGATVIIIPQYLQHLGFNPRSPRGGATAFHSTALPCYCGFNPRSPRGGATIVKNFIIANQTMFQSTLPTRGSDWHSLLNWYFAVGFNPRSPRGGATNAHLTRFQHIKVSIHAPHEGERPKRRSCRRLPSRCFNPRSPRGGATRILRRLHQQFSVSIHAPHEGERP